MEINYFATKCVKNLTLHAKFRLSCLLNPKKVLLSENGLPRDWRGLAQLVDLSREDISYIKDTECDYTEKVLELWLERKMKLAQIGKLFDILKRIDRFDICHDLEEFIVQGSLINSKRNKIPINRGLNNKELLTYEDKQYGLQTYHAFVLYAKENEDFVLDLKRNMRDIGNREGTHIKICTKDDILPVHCTQYVPVSKLIMERCYYIIVAYSEYFFKESANKFFVNYAIDVSDDKCDGDTVLIPCVMGDYQLPDELNSYVTLEYNPGRLLTYDIWEKIYEAIREPPQSHRIKVPKKNTPIRKHVTSGFRNLSFDKPRTEILKFLPNSWSSNLSKKWSKSEVVQFNGTSEINSTSSVSTQITVPSDEQVVQGFVKDSIDISKRLEKITNGVHNVVFKDDSEQTQEIKLRLDTINESRTVSEVLGEMTNIPGNEVEIISNEVSGEIVPKLDDDDEILRLKEKEGILEEAQSSQNAKKLNLKDSLRDVLYGFKKRRSKKVQRKAVMMC